MKLIFKIILVFLIILLSFVLLGYWFFMHLQEPKNYIFFLVISHLGLIMAIYVSKKVIPQKKLSHKAVETKVV